MFNCHLNFKVTQVKIIILLPVNVCLASVFTFTCKGMLSFETPKIENLRSYLFLLPSIFLLVTLIPDSTLIPPHEAPPPTWPRHTHLNITGSASSLPPIQFITISHSDYFLYILPLLLFSPPELSSKTTSSCHSLPETLSCLNCPIYKTKLLGIIFIVLLDLTSISFSSHTSHVALRHSGKYGMWIHKSINPCLTSLFCPCYALPKHPPTHQSIKRGTTRW